MEGPPEGVPPSATRVHYTALAGDGPYDAWITAENRNGTVNLSVMPTRYWQPWQTPLILTMIRLDPRGAPGTCRRIP